MSDPERPPIPHSTIEFITGSRFTGQFDPIKHTMEGFGTYVYPNGSEYRGFFKNGLFHGYGQMKLAPPVNSTICGRYEKGVLVETTKMIFPRGLSIEGEEDAEGARHIDLNQWNYCKGDDRRYSRELAHGLTPVGPSSCETRTDPARVLPAGCYDTEQGIFNTSTGFISGIPPPFRPQRLVLCESEMEAIKNKCRRSYPRGCAPEPEAAKGWEILKTNADEMMQLNSNKDCECGDELLRGDIPKTMQPGEFIRASLNRCPLHGSGRSSMESGLGSVSKFDVPQTMKQKDYLRGIEKALETLSLSDAEKKELQKDLIDPRKSNDSAISKNSRRSTR